MKVEVGKNGIKGVKRERDDDGGNGDGGVIEILSDDDDIGSLQVMHTKMPYLSDFYVVQIQDELKRLQDRIARKKAKKSVKREPVSSADDIIDLT